MSPLSVLATSCVPVGVRGALNQWMLEVLPGVFVGRPSARVRGQLWAALTSSLGAEPDAYAAWISQDDSDQGFRIERFGDHRYSVTEHWGIQLITVRHRSEASASEPIGIEDF